MTVINLRGTSGAGKSTVVTRVMALYPERVPVPRPKGKRPAAYVLRRPGAPPLFVPGHYETACGGCDTLKTVDEVYTMVRGAVEAGSDVLYEGIMVQDDLRRAVALDQWVKLRNMVPPDGGSEDPEGIHVIRLTTPIELSLAAVRARREARGETKPLNEKNTRARHETQVRMVGRLITAGVAVDELDREQAYARVCALLGLPVGTAAGGG